MRAGLFVLVACSAPASPPLLSHHAASPAGPLFATLFAANTTTTFAEEVVDHGVVKRATVRCYVTEVRAVADKWESHWGCGGEDIDGGIVADGTERVFTAARDKLWEGGLARAASEPPMLVADQRATHARTPDVDRTIAAHAGGWCVIDARTPTVDARDPTTVTWTLCFRDPDGVIGGSYDDRASGFAVYWGETPR